MFKMCCLNETEHWNIHLHGFMQTKADGIQCFSNKFSTTKKFRFPKSYREQKVGSHDETLDKSATKWSIIM